MTGNAKTITKVIYKPDSQSTEEFMTIVDHDEYTNWKNGDTSIPLARVVDSFDIFVSEQGSQGLLGRASKQQLQTVFGSSNEDEAIKVLLQKGTVKTGEALPKGWQGRNDARGSNVDTQTAGH